MKTQQFFFFTFFVFTKILWHFSVKTNWHIDNRGMCSGQLLAILMMFFKNNNIHINNGFFYPPSGTPPDTPLRTRPPLIHQKWIICRVFFNCSLSLLDKNSAKLSYGKPWHLIRIYQQVDLIEPELRRDPKETHAIILASSCRLDDPKTTAKTKSII